MFVLRGTFLQENAQPPLAGQFIVLHQVTRQEWRVPTVVAKHYDTDNNNKSGGHNKNNTSKQPPPYVPRYVFVVEHAHQIQVILEDEEDNDDNDNDPLKTSTSVQIELIITTLNKQPPDQDNGVASPSLCGRRRRQQQQQQQQLEENSSRCDDNKNKDWSLWEVVEGTIQSVHWIQTIPSRGHLIQPSPLPRPTSSSSPKVVVTIEPLWYAGQKFLQKVGTGHGINVVVPNNF